MAALQQLGIQVPPHGRAPVDFVGSQPPMEVGAASENPKVGPPIVPAGTQQPRDTRSVMTGKSDSSARGATKSGNSPPRSGHAPASSGRADGETHENIYHQSLPDELEE